VAVPHRKDDAIEGRIADGDGTTPIEVRVAAFDEAGVELVSSSVRYGPGGDWTIDGALRTGPRRLATMEPTLTSDAIARAAAIVDSSEDAIIGMTLAGSITSWNPAAQRTYGYAADEAVGQNLAWLLSSQQQKDEFTHVLGRVAVGDHVDHALSTRRRKDGRVLDVFVTASPIRDSHGEIIGVSTLARDVTDRKHAADALAEAEERFRGAFEEAAIGMALLDLGGRFTRVNQALCAITGYARGQLEGMMADAITHPDDVQTEREALAMIRAGDQTASQAERRYIHADGHAVWVAAQITLIRDRAGAPLRFLGQVRDITDSKRYEDKLQELADHDSLTGLLNRRSFSRALSFHAALVTRYGQEGALLLLDLDHFKYVNDTVGHQAGDEVIVRTAELLRQRLRDTDVFARLGGDEFAVLLPKGDSNDAGLVAQGLLQALRDEPVALAGVGARTMTASVGVAIFEPNLTGEDVLVNADLAMYDAKEAGRDRVALFSTEEHAQSRMKSRIGWAQRIRHALDEDGFSLLAQPIIDFSTGRVTQHELLLRMDDERGDVIAPGAFLYIAERLDMIQQIDAWVITNAIGMLAKSDSDGLPLEINISGRSIGDLKLLELIDEELRRTGVAPGRLILEITETAAIEHIAKARRFAEYLGELGCRFALDDFGAGFGSFYYLKQLPFDFLKIDGEFIANCASNTTDRLIIQAVVSIARGLAKSTIAEFVGDDETVRLLARLGVDYGQGYHLGRPAPANDLITGPASHMAPGPASPDGCSDGAAAR
jgi:diguanylate cyclase (GGDEF)-like protein/PAS domain S-box-containing protein